MTGHSHWVRSLAVLQNGDLTSGSNDQPIKIWDSSTGSLRMTLIGHSYGVYSLAVLQNGIWQVDHGIIQSRYGIVQQDH